MIAAVLAYWNTTRSISHARQLDKEKRTRKHAALRAVLPLALSDITQYAAKTSVGLIRLINLCENEVAPKIAVARELQIEAVPSSSIDELAEFIEYSEARDAEVLEATLARIQIHDARLRRLLESAASDQGVVTRHNLESLVVDAAIVYAGASSFFAYARRSAEHPPVELSWEIVYKALINMNVWPEAYGRVHENVARRELLYENASELAAPKPRPAPQ